MQIHIAKDGIQSGPFSPEQIEAKLLAGEFNGRELAWQEGMADWQPLSTLVPTSGTIAQVQPSNLSIDPYSAPVSVGGPMPIYPAGGGPVGIGGWLLFYCVSLTILSPLFLAFQIYTSTSTIDSLKGRFPNLVSALYVESCGVGLIGVGCIIVGLLLWNQHPSSIRIVKTFLIVRLLLFIATEAITLYLMRDLDEKIVTAAIGGMVGACLRAVVGFAVWWSYFKRSKRVANTFPNPGPAQ